MWMYFPLSMACPQSEHFWEGFWGELCTGSYVDLCCYLFSMLTEHKELQLDCTAFQETQDTFLPLHKAILDGNFSPCRYHPSNWGWCSCWMIPSPDSVTSRHQDTPLWFWGRSLPGMSCLCACSRQTASLLLGYSLGWGDLNLCPFAWWAAQNCTHGTAEVSGGTKKKEILHTVEMMCGCHSSASQQKTPLGCIWELLASCAVGHYGRRVNLWDYWLLLCGDSWGVWAFVI